MADVNRADVLDDLERLRELFDHLKQHPSRTERGERMLAEGAQRLEVIRRQLADSDDCFDQIVENIREVLWITSPDYGVMHFVSPAYADIWGRSCEELLRAPQSWAAAIHESDRDRVHTALLRDSHHGRFNEEYRIVRPDGSVRWIHDRAFPVPDATGEVCRIVGIAEDITVRKLDEQDLRDAHGALEHRIVERTAELQAANAVLQEEVEERSRAETQLRSREEQYRRIADDQTDFVVRWSPDGTRTFVNEAYCRMHGRSYVDLVGTSLFPTLRDEARRHALREKIQSLTPETPLTEHEHETRLGDGSRAWQHWMHRALFDRQGTLTEVQSVGRDVTPRRVAEEALRKELKFSDQILSSVTDGILAYNSDLRYTIWNPGMERISGLSAADVLGKRALELFPFLKAVGADRVHRDTLAGKSGIIADQRFDVPRTGRSGYFEARYSPLRDESGEVIGGLAVVRDVTERLQAGEAARQQHDNLAHLTRVSTMGEMAAGVAHELNQPLSAIATYSFTAGTLLHEFPGASAELRTVLEKIEQQAVRAGEIVQRLRQFVRKIPPVHEPVRVDVLVENVFTFLASDARLSEVVPDVSIEPVTPSIVVDPVQIQQVLINLIRNALDAMNVANVDDCRLAVVAHATHDGFVEVSVSDTGAGIGRNHAERVFDTFFSTKADGMGMGLAISRSIVEEHGGRLWFEDNAGPGTTFRLTLPIVEAGTDDEARFIS